MTILNDMIVMLVLVGILVGTWSLYNIWLGCEEDRLEEIIAARCGISPSTMRDVYNAYVVEYHRTAMKPDSYLKYLKDFIEEYEMTKPIAYIHIDTESTTLDRFSGHVRSIGWIITDGRLNELGRGEVEVLVDPMLWDPSTLEWAKEIYPEETILAWELTGAIDWPSIATELMLQFLPVVQEWKVEKGYEVWTITNHPEFDMSMLEACCKLAGMKDKWPFKYNHNLDWQSLYLAWHNSSRAIRDGIQSYKDILGWADPAKGKENVAHTALADVERQLGVLRNVGVVLP